MFVFWVYEDYRRDILFKPNRGFPGFSCSGSGSQPLERVASHGIPLKKRSLTLAALLLGLLGLGTLGKISL